MGYDGSLKFDTKVDESGFSSGISKLGGIAKGGLAVLGSAVVGASAAFVGLAKSALDSTASLEQNIGGVETLFKGSAKTVIDNANKAYKTAGMSANEYMQSVTSFSASLLQSVAGDTDKAAQVADMAMIDMSDNANKMGTNMQDIQNAYQGFAKQNYTMLDNLKLGYGGTKSEMERLLADAEKISGVKYDINNLKDVYSAIHVIQGELDITGTTAKEAATTIEGSMNAARAAFDNYLNGSGSVEEFVDAFSVAAQNIGKNLMEIVPRLAATIPQIVSAMAQQLQTAVSGDGAVQFASTGAAVVTSLVTGLTGALPSLLSAGISFIGALITSINASLPFLIDSGGQILTTLVQGIVTLLPMLGELALNLVLQLAQGITDNASQIMTQGVDILLQFVNGILSSLPQIITAGIQLIIALVNGLVEALPRLISYLPTIIGTILNVIGGALPQIIEAGVKILVSLINGLIDAIPRLIAAVPQIIAGLINAIISNIPQFISSGIRIIGALAAGLIQAIPSIIGAVPRIISSVINSFRSVNWGDVGVNIIRGIASGLAGAAGAIVDAAVNAARSALNAAKRFLGIHSPSTVFRDQVGKYMGLGVGVGFEKNIPTGDMNNALSNSVQKMQKKVGTVTKAQAGTVNSQVSGAKLKNPDDTDQRPIEITNIFEVDGDPLVKKTTKATIKKISGDRKTSTRFKGK